VKMAKASAADLDMAMDLSNYCDAISRGHMPDDISKDEECIEWLDSSDSCQYKRLLRGLQALLCKGSIFRVVFGMAVVCDPSNQCIDPEADTIEHHPMRQQMENALLWTLYHHQGASSRVGQPIRALLGIGQYDRLTDEQLAAAKSFGEASSRSDKGVTA
jgi:hypothetical protein